MNLDYYRSHEIGIVFQSYNLLPQFTAEENIILSMDINNLKKVDKKKKAIELSEKLAKVTLEFTVKTGAGDKVFGSISVKQIKDELQKKGYSIEKSMIDIKTPIASLGFHNVDINLYPEIVATIKVHVIK